MRIIVAPDSYKGSLSAKRAAEIMARAVTDVFAAIPVEMPVADGGEGTLEAILAGGKGRYLEAEVTSPLGKRISARWGMLEDGTAVIEMAQASGLTLAPEKDPLRATSYGTGELMAAALAAGAKRILMGIGGSATNDGGMGMLTALGAVFRDAQGNRLTGSGAELEKIASADLRALPRVEIRVICDVTNPLLGLEGATAVYGPQKGVTPELLPRLEAGMAHYARALAQEGCPDCALAGAGAAGGLGYALAGVLGARLEPGIDAVLDAVGFDRALEQADLVLTGEGKLDRQSLRYGKAPVGIARRCAARGVPVIALAGTLGTGAEGFLTEGLTAMEAITDGPMPLETAMEQAPELLRRATVRALSAVKIGLEMKRPRGLPQLSMRYQGKAIPFSPAPGVRLRHYEERDFSGMVQALLPLTKTPYNHATLEEVILRHRGVTTDTVFLAETENGIVGTATGYTHPADPFHPGDAGGTLHMVSVLPQAKGRKIGFAVCAAAVNALLEKVCVYVDLTTDDFRLPAIVTYLRMGFRPVIDTEETRERWERVCEKIDMPEILKEAFKKA